METGPPGVRGRSEIERVFGRRVREVREAVGLSQAQLAKELVKRGVKLSPSQVAKVERGERPTNVAEAWALKVALKVEMGWLFGEGDKSPEELRSMEIAWHLSRIQQRERELTAELDMLNRERERLWQATQAGGVSDGEHPEAP